MAKGRPVDPGRERRGTGHRPAAGKGKALAVVPDELLPAVASNLPDPPATLPESVHEVWRTAVAEMGGNRHLREVDLIQLNIWCEAIYVHAEASANVHKYGVLVKGKSGPIPNPMLKVQKDAAGTIRQISDVLGLNPLARIRAGLMEITGASMLSTISNQLDKRA